MHNANNMPQMLASTYTSQAYNGLGTQAMGVVWPTQGAGLCSGDIHNQMQDQNYHTAVQAIQEQKQERKAKVADPKRRLVKVIIVDPDEKVPLEKCVLYSGDEKLTDLTDQELFFEVEIKDVLHDHNELRKKVIDKSVKERTEYLEPVKVRDLRMVVVTVAQF